MDKLNPTFQATPVTTQATAGVSSWFTSEYTGGIFTESQLGWLHAAGWRVTAAVIENTRSWYALTRRVVKPENILRSLVSDYTDAYNEGRQLNDQRYDDLLVLYTAVLDKTENAFNALETDDDAYEVLIEAIVTAVGTDYTTYAADVDDDLDSWGTDLLAEINARFDAESSKAQQSLVDRGLYSSTMWVTFSAGVERERTRALNNANDQIEQRQLELKHKVYAEQQSMRGRMLEARTRLRAYLSSARDRQVVVRNAAAETIGRLVEARTDGYPDLSEIGQLAASLGAGSAQAFSP